MSWWTLLDGGYSMPAQKTWGQRLSSRVGRWLASRHPMTDIHPTCLISPEARIHPRDGFIGIGERSTVALGVLLQGNVTIGRNCSIQAYSNIVGYGSKQQPAGLITIGDDVRIASHAIIIAGNHRFADPDRPIRTQGLDLAPITIENDVWIAGRVNIMAGVTIGRGSVIGGGSVVTKDIPPYSLAVGVPARVIASRRQS
ncbi:acyltransferase [Cohnella fermenti]|uniref:Acetyltransferase n=1 Tax=Cohnella fermenti TaxID=2565925 RepID=A0A4V3WF66_9BACL|nr:acetyltransferase [Cohnella fermenti]